MRPCSTTVAMEVSGVSLPSGGTLTAFLTSWQLFARMTVRTSILIGSRLLPNNLHYPTSSEAAYPFLLCTRLDSVKSQLTESGALDPQNLQEQIEVEDRNSHSFILGMLPRGKSMTLNVTSSLVTTTC